MTKGKFDEFDESGSIHQTKTTQYANNVAIYVVTDGVGCLLLFY